MNYERQAQTIEQESSSLKIIEIFKPVLPR